MNISGSQFFDDEGRPVHVAMPEVYTDEPDNFEMLSLADVFDLLLFSVDSNDEIASRVRTIGYLMKSELAPKTLSELGRELGMSKQAAAKRLTAFKRKCRRILQSRLTKPHFPALVE